MRSLPWAVGVLLAVQGAAACTVDTSTGEHAGPSAVTSRTSSPAHAPVHALTHAPTRTRRPHPTPSHAAPAARGTALAVLATLAVKGRAPMTGYSREQFGQAWLDANRNGCDTRNDILGRDLVRVTFKPGTRDCVALTGTLPNPYTGTDVAFARGVGDDVDIDHVVALGDAWATGAFKLPFKSRAALANDPFNLLAVDSHDNRSKGDADAASWLPPARGYRCAYVARQVAVKKKYGLWVTRAEHDAIARVLATCPGQQVPDDVTHAPTTVDLNISPPASSGSSSKPLGLSGGASGSVYYKNCDAVRAAGKAPIHRGDPGYAPHLDRDGDGVGCED